MLKVLIASIAVAPAAYGFSYPAPLRRMPAASVPIVEIGGAPSAMPFATTLKQIQVRMRAALPSMVETAGIQIGGGMFTRSNPEDRRVMPDDAGNREIFRVVYVVLESQYQASISAACMRINVGQPHAAVECSGYILEELRDPANFAQFKQDVQSANIFIGSLIFVQDLADKVQSFLHRCTST